MSLYNDDNYIVCEIRKITQKKNKDNISRTDSYFNFYIHNPDIEWSFLASMVSRNGGYNMCDLEGDVYPKLISPPVRRRLFLTYERANWLIFHDVFPQLLIYEYSTKLGRPLFHLLKEFNVSNFIHKEWVYYWENRDRKRLMISLIINEQNVIQKPIIEHHLYKRRVFNSFLFRFEDLFHFSCVIFPTLNGKIYGASVNGFRKLDKRINLGKRLADILFLPNLYNDFFEFARTQFHTGSRYDYERFLGRNIYRRTPFLRTTFPVVQHHIHEKKDWSRDKKIRNSWIDRTIEHIHPILLNGWYEHKQNQIMLAASVSQLLSRKETD